MDAVRTGPKVRAPEFPSGDWFNTEEPLTLAGLRGRFVLLDFWTFCCGNCLHVLDELRPLEQRLVDVLTVVGVHSPKFPHEADPVALAAAIDRYEVHHPVVNDPALAMWQQYAVRAWPTLVLVDPEGYVVAQAAGEGQVAALGSIVDSTLATHDAKGTLRRGTGPYVPPPAAPGALRFPADALVLPGSRTGRDRDTLLVADAGHHQLVELELDGETELRRLGTGRGEPFAEPNGVTLLPAGLVDGVDVLVADTAHHVVRGVRLDDFTLTTTYDLPALLADELTITGAIPLALSPWDLVWWPAAERVVVAAAGVHLLLALDPVAHTAEVLAGTTVEGLRDGAALDAWLAQPSGLAVGGDAGELVWFADAETSALRSLDVHGVVRTAVGEGLFDFGHVDGPASVARFQHPLGVTVLGDGSIAVLDTYNGAVRRFDPATDEVTTLARGLAEPSAALPVGDDLVVVESAAHRLTATPLAAELIDGVAQRTERPPSALRAGRVRLTVVYRPAPGRKADDRYGPATMLSISGDPTLLVAGEGDSVELTREVELAPGTGVLSVTARAAACSDDPTVDHPACELSRQDWGIPVVVGDTGDETLDLVLLG